jgi:hypothetical protein
MIRITGDDGAMTEAEIIEFAAGLEGVAVLKASEESGAPEVAWGDSFFFYAPPGDEPSDQRHPFATLVRGDYPSFDVESQLDRPGAFRLNLAVGRDHYQRLLGHPAADHEQHHSDYDYTEADVVLPHPVYASQGWVSIVNPGSRTADQVKELFSYALDLAGARYRRRSRTAPGARD